jgi:purine-nucleoside phosphorylase
MDLLQKLKETVHFLKDQYPSQPSTGIILGSGLGSFTGEIMVEKEVAYADIPHFPVSTVEGHKGKLVFGKLNGNTVLSMAGRFHYYEGYSAAEVVYPVRVMKMLGVKTLLLSNAAGAVNRSYQVGDLVIINDHISFFTPNPLVGRNYDELGTRFPDMSEPYKKSLISLAKKIASKNQLPVHEGVYVSVTGPTFETPAEYRFIEAMGADLVGMSTVQEAIAAHHMGLDVFAISVVTDLAARDEHNPITHEEVLQAARQAEPRLALLFRELIGEL